MRYPRRYARDPDTKQRRLDPISLAPFPQKYAVRSPNGSYHDARQLAMYILNGGTRHPLSRRLFTMTELDAIHQKVKHLRPLNGAHQRIHHIHLNIRILGHVVQDRVLKFLAELAATCFQYVISFDEALRLALDHPTINSMLEAIATVLDQPDVTPLDAVNLALVKSSLGIDRARLILGHMNCDDLEEKQLFEASLPRAFRPTTIPPDTWRALIQKFATFLMSRMYHV